MSFYSEIAKYYDYIFPASKETVDCISGIAGNPPKALLDIACGTGCYSIELERLGYDITAVDIDSKMIDNVKVKAKDIGSRVKFMKADMLDLNIRFDKKSFVLAFCIGNSLVHLDDLSQIRNFFYKIKDILKIDGSLIVQVINFDRIISQDIKSLPTIYNKEVDLTFERQYRYDSKKNKVFFKTILTVAKKKFKNEIALCPLLYEDAKKMLQDTGFKKIEFFGDFEGASFDKDNSFMMVIHAK